MTDCATVFDLKLNKVDPCYDLFLSKATASCCLPPLDHALVSSSVLQSRARRCSSVRCTNCFEFEFLQTLNLKSVVLMEQNVLDDNFADFLAEHNISIIDPSVTAKDNPAMKAALIPISDEIVTEALRAISTPQNLPTLIICKTGKTYTSTLVACLRKLHKWSMMSILEEFRRYAVGTKNQQQLEQLIELYDIEQFDVSELSTPFIKKEGEREG